MWLWEVVARPILDALGYTQHIGSIDSRPRTWWIQTGQMSRYWIHAAVLHVTSLSESVLDRAMSSYNSSIKAIIEVGWGETQPPSRPPVVLVAMKDTPSYSTLDFTECFAIYACLCTSKFVEPARLKVDVLSHMRRCMVFHFAGHGHTDPENPSKSKLLLDDRKTDSMTVGNLLDVNLREHSSLRHRTDRRREFSWWECSSH